MLPRRRLIGHFEWKCILYFGGGKKSICLQSTPFSENVLLCFENGESSKMQIKSCMSQEKWILFTLRFHLSKNNNQLPRAKKPYLTVPFFRNNFTLVKLDIQCFHEVLNIRYRHFYSRCTPNKVLVTFPGQNERGCLRPF